MGTKNAISVWLRMQALAARLGVSLRELLAMDASAVKAALDGRTAS